MDNIMDNIMKVEMEALLENLSLARAVVAAYCLKLDPTVEEITEIKTAVSEAFSNCVIHGYQGNQGNQGNQCGKVLLELGIRDNVIKIKVSDFGIGIEDIEKAMEPLFTTDEGSERSGMGFTLMESFMDKVRVKSQLGEGTEITLVKRIDTYHG